MATVICFAPEEDLFSEAGSDLLQPTSASRTAEQKMRRRKDLDFIRKDKQIQRFKRRFGSEQLLRPGTATLLFFLPLVLFDDSVELWVVERAGFSGISHR